LIKKGQWRKEASLPVNRIQAPEFIHGEQKKSWLERQSINSRGQLLLDCPVLGSDYPGLKRPEQIDSSSLVVLRFRNHPPSNHGRGNLGVVAPTKNQCFWDYWLDAVAIAIRGMSYRLLTLLLGLGFETHLHRYICLYGRFLTAARLFNVHLIIRTHGHTEATRHHFIQLHSHLSLTLRIERF